MSENVNQFGVTSPKYLTSANDTVFVIDHITGAMKTVTTDHAYIHQGIFFESSLTATLTAGGSINFVIKTPSDVFIHWRPALVSCSGDKLTISLYEGCTTGAGTLISSYNHNRIKTAIASLTITRTATVTSDGTLISRNYIGGGTGVGGNRSGGTTGIENEWIFKQSTNYCLRFTNGSSADNAIIANAVWYSETSGG